MINERNGIFPCNNAWKSIDCMCDVYWRLVVKVCFSHFSCNFSLCRAQLTLHWHRSCCAVVLSLLLCLRLVSIMTRAHLPPGLRLKALCEARSASQILPGCVEDIPACNGFFFLGGGLFCIKTDLNKNKNQNKIAPIIWFLYWSVFKKDKLI